MKTRADVIKERIITLANRWSENGVDISEHYNEWIEFLTTNNVLVTYK